VSSTGAAQLKAEAFSGIWKIQNHCKSWPRKGQVTTCYCCGGETKKSGRFENRNRIVQRFACKRCGKTFSEEQPLNGLRVDFKQAAQVVHLLVEGMGIRAIQRFTGLHQETILSILEMAGQKAASFSDANVRNLSPKLVQADEMHCFVFCRQQNNIHNIEDIGEQFMFLSIDRDSKLIISSLIGRRTRENADYFMGDLKKRTVARFQLTTDNWKTYSGYGESSVMADFGANVDYATEKKIFAQPVPYLPRRVTSIRRKARIGCPDMTQATINHCERTNLSVRLFTKRFTRCTLGYSKKLENLKLAASLFVWHFNFVRVHSTHKQTPAMTAGLINKPMTIEELLSGTI
jgi:transposase-like protein/IS1 family transposase